MPSADTASAPGPRPEPGFPPELAGRFVVRREGRRSALVRSDFAAAFDAVGLLDAASLEPEELVARLAERTPEGGSGGAGRTASGGAGRTDRGARLLPTASGRGAVAVVPAGPLGEAVVRLYRRGGLAGRFSRRCYLAGRRGERELLVTDRLRSRGVPVVEPLACVREALRPGYRAALVTRLVEGARPAGELLADLGARGPEGATPRSGASGAADVASLMRALGRTAARLHAVGGWHADLHADNFLVRPAGTATGPSTDAEPPWDPAPLLVDLDRGRLLPFPVPLAVGRWSLRRLARHLGKRGLKDALAAFDALETAYLEARERMETGERGSSGA